MRLDGWISEFGGVQGDYFSRKYYVLHNENFGKNMKEYIRLCHGKDVYQCAYHYETQDYETCQIIGNPYLDFDTEGIESKENWGRLVKEVKYVVNYVESSLAIPAEELQLYFSGSKGFHLIVPHECIGIQPKKDLNEDFKLFAEGIAYIRNGRRAEAVRHGSIDLKIYDRKRLFRIPNTINAKSGRYKVPVTVSQLYSMDYTGIMEWASRPRIPMFRPPHYRAASEEGYVAIINSGIEYENKKNMGQRPRKKRKVGENKPMELLPCAKKLLETGAFKGERNISCFALASSLFQTGLKIDDVYEEIDGWNQRCEEPLPDREIMTTVQSAQSSYESGMYVGCGKYRELDLCMDNCPLANA